MGLGEHGAKDGNKAVEEVLLKPINSKDIEDKGIEDKGIEDKDIESAASTHKQGTWQKLSSCKFPLVCVTVAITVIVILISVISVIIGLYGRSPSSKQEHITCDKCEDGWITYRDKCYYHSDELDTWNNSQEFCKEHNSSLAIIDNKEEYKFLNLIKGDDNRWIGLSRTEDNSGWVWTNGTLYSGDIFQIERMYAVPGEVEGVYLTYDGVKSRSGNYVRKWICSNKLLVKPS